MSCKNELFAPLNIDLEKEPSVYDSGVNLSLETFWMRTHWVMHQVDSSIMIV